MQLYKTTFAQCVHLIFIFDFWNQVTTKLGVDETRAVAAHLIANVNAFRDAYANPMLLPDAQEGSTQDSTQDSTHRTLSSAAVVQMLSKCEVMELKESEWLLPIDEEVRIIYISYLVLFFLVCLFVFFLSFFCLFLSFLSFFLFFCFFLLNIQNCLTCLLLCFFFVFFVFFVLLFL